MPYGDDGLPADGRGNKVAGLGQLALVAQIDPEWPSELHTPRYGVVITGPDAGSSNHGDSSQR